MNTTTLNMTTLDGGVIIKKETAPAPPSGGDSASTIEYLDMSGDSPLRDALIAFCCLIKTDGFNIERPGNSVNASRAVVPSGHLLPTVLGMTYEEFVIVQDSINAVAIDFNTEIIMGDAPMTIKDVFTGAEELLDAIPRLTKEQFYSLD